MLGSNEQYANNDKILRIRAFQQYYPLDAESTFGDGVTIYLITFLENS